MRELRYILLLLVVGLYTSWQRVDVPVQADASCPSASESSMPSVLHNTLEDYAKRMQLQYDWTDALTSYQIGTRSEDNRLRTRRQERVSSSASTYTYRGFACSIAIRGKPYRTQYQSNSGNVTNDAT